MITAIHHNIELKPTNRSQRRFTVAAAVAALLVIIGTAGMTYGVSAVKMQPTVTSVARPLDEAGLGSARTLLIASMEPEMSVVIVPAASCSPFGSLTACASRDLIGRSPITLHAPI